MTRRPASQPARHAFHPSPAPTAALRVSAGPAVQSRLYIAQWYGIIGMNLKGGRSGTNMDAPLLSKLRLESVLETRDRWRRLTAVCDALGGRRRFAHR